MAEHEDLGFLRRGIGPVDTKDLENASDETVDEGQGQGGRDWPMASCLVKADRRDCEPFKVVYAAVVVTAVRADAT
jgi:hypothetical protein